MEAQGRLQVWQEKCPVLWAIPRRENKMARAGSPGQHKLSLCRRFLLDDYFQVRGHILVQLYGDGKLSHGF